MKEFVFDHNIVDFGEVNVNSTSIVTDGTTFFGASKELVVTNNSDYIYVFNISVNDSQSSDRETFRLSSSSPNWDNFVVPPRESRTITVTFSPTLIKKYENQHLEFSWMKYKSVSRTDESIYSVSPTIIPLYGVGVLPLKLSTTHVDFKKICLNKTYASIISIINESNIGIDIDASFDPNNRYYSIDESSFKIEPKLSTDESDTSNIKDIVISFNPEEIGTYKNDLTFTIKTSPYMLETLKINLEGISDAPIILSSLNKIDFNNTKVYDTIIKEFTLSNSNQYVGLDIDLSIDSDIFTVSPNLKVIHPGSTQKFSVSFTPIDTIEYNATLTITNNSTNNPEISIPLKGAGKSLNVDFTGLDIQDDEYYLDFERVCINSNKTISVVITNTSTSENLDISRILISSNFSYTIIKYSLLPEESTTLLVKFNPTKTIDYTGTINIVFNELEESEVAINLVGVGYVSPVISVSSTTINFGKNAIGKIYSKNIKITNSGLSELNVTNIVSEGKFNTDVTSFRIKSGEYYNLSVVYTPAIIGIESGTITLFSNIYGDETGETAFPLSAVGEALQSPISIESNEVDYGDVLSGNVLDKYIVLTNISSNNVIINNILINNDSFSVIDTLPITITPNQTKNIKIRGSAQYLTPQTGALSIYEDTLGLLSQTITLTISTIYPIIKVSSTSLSFDKVLVNKTNTISLTIKNEGTGALNISDIESDSPYYTIGSYKTAINPSSEISLDIKFKPEIPHFLAGNITISSNDLSNPITVIVVSGYGITPLDYDMYSFDNAEEVPLPYTVEAQPVLYKWSLLNLEKDLSYFEISYDNRVILFESGQLIAVKSKVTNDIYFHIIDNYVIEDLIKSNDKKKTKVNIKDTFRINFIDPDMYKFDTPAWVDIINSYIIDLSTNSITINGNLLGSIKKSHLVSFQNKYVYRVESVELINGNTKVVLSPDFKEDHTQSYFGNLKVSDVPIYIDEPTRQPLFVISYNSSDYYATINILDDKLVLGEYILGETTPSSSVELIFNEYANINILIDTINNINSGLFSGKAFTVLNYYEDLFNSGGFDVFKLLPTYDTMQILPFSVYVQVSTFDIVYIVPPSYNGYAEVSFNSDYITLKEVLSKDNIVIEPASYTIVISNFDTIYSVIDYINSLVSTISGLASFSVGEYVGVLSPDLFFENGIKGTYLIPSYSTPIFKELPQPVSAVVYPESFTLLSPLNKRKLILNTDYTIENGSLTLTESIKKLDRFSLNYLGLDNLSDKENEDINVYCRFFSSLPVNSKVVTYMDYLNIDQFYIQKLTERKFLETITAPQIQQLLQQKMGGNGIGSSTGGSPQPKNHEGGSTSLYYQLRDEQIKKLLYLKIYKWYKRRLRFFAAEAQLILGFKYGHSTHYYAEYPMDNEKISTYDFLINYTLDDDKVESQIDYELTTEKDINGISKDFSKFFPIGYNGTAPKYYDRFGKEYLNYSECYCYNIKFLDELVNGKPKVQGYVRSYKPYWGGENLDYKILKNASTNLVSDIVIPIDSEETTYSANEFSFLKRVKIGDSLKIEGNTTYYKIGNILGPSYKGLTVKTSNKKDAPKESTYDLAETLVLEDGKYFKEKNVPTFNIGTYGGAAPVPSYRNLVRKKLFSNPPRGSTEIRVYSNGSTSNQSTSNMKYKLYYVSYIPMEDFVSKLGTENFKIYIKRQQAESFPVYNDSGNYGVTAYSGKIKGHVKNTNRIKKISFADIMLLLFPGLSEEPNKNFRMSIGTYNEDDGSFRQGSFDNKTDIFNEDSELDADNEDGESELPGQPTINLKKLTFFEERKVSDTMEVLLRDLEKVGEIPIPLLPLGKMYVYRTYPKGSPYGLNKFFYIDFDRSYDSEEENGYVNSLIFNTINRDNWFIFRKSNDEDVTDVYCENFLNTTMGIDVLSAINSSRVLYKGFYDPRGLYQKLVLEKQAWLTEEEVLHRLFDVQLKLSRAFSADTIYTINGVAITEGTINADSDFILGTNAENRSISYSNYRGYLLQVGDILKNRMNKYLNLMRFLVSSDTSNMGPVSSILLENDASDAILDSYNKTLETYNRYTDFIGKTFDNPNSFYNINNYNLSVWKGDYVRWVLSLTEGTIFQKQAENHIKENLTISMGIELFNAIRIKYNNTSTSCTITNPKVLIGYDVSSKDLAMTLSCHYKSTITNVEGETNVEGDFSLVVPFITYQTLNSLISKVNSYKYPTNVQFFNLTLLFDYYPKGSYACTRLEKISSTDIPATGVVLKVSNYSDHRQYDARVLYLNKDKSDSISMSNEVFLNVFPKYVAYYNDPNNPNYADTLYDGKKAINGLKVPGEWVILEESSFNVMELSPIDINYNISYTFLDVYDDDNETPVSDYEYNVYIPDQTNSRTWNELRDTVTNAYGPEKTYKEVFSDILNKIKKQEENRESSINSTYSDYLTNTEYNILNLIDKGSRPNSIIIKTLTLILTDDTNNKIQINIDTRSYRTINDLIKVLNGYFYENENNIWIPVTDQVSTDPTINLDYKTFFTATLVGDSTIQGEMSTFELDLDYTNSLKSFYYYKEGILEYNTTSEIDPNLKRLIESQGGEIIYNTDNNTVLVRKPYYVQGSSIGWVPSYIFDDISGAVTFRVREVPYYSYSNTYRFKPLFGEEARNWSIQNNSNLPNNDILPFDLYCLDQATSPTPAVAEEYGAYYKITNNILYISVVSTAVNDFEIPLSETETLKQLVDRINSKIEINQNIYANLKFLRDQEESEDIGNFVYTYLPDISSTAITKSYWHPLYLADDNVIAINGSNVSNAEYRINNGSTALSLKGDVNVFSIQKNYLKYTLSNTTYAIGGGNLTLDTDYAYNYSYKKSFAFYSALSLNSLKTIVEAEKDPILSQNIFQYAIVGDETKSSTKLKNTSGTLPIILSTDSVLTVVSISLKTPGVGVSFSSATCSVYNNVLTLNVTMTYTGTIPTETISLTQSIDDIVSYIETIKPYPSFEGVFLSEALSSYYASQLGTILNTIATTSISTVAYPTATVENTYNLVGTIKDLHDAVNLNTAISGFYMEYLFSGDGYKSVPSSYLVDTDNIYISLTGTVSLAAVLSGIEAAYVLSLNKDASVSVLDNQLIVTSNYPGSYTYDLPTDKDLQSYISDIRGNFYEDLKSIDILIKGASGVPYGTLFSPTDVSIIEANAVPTHVYLEILGDISFYQISDYNLYNQLSVVKQRIAKPWKVLNKDGILVKEYDPYNDMDFYDSFIGDASISPDGNIQALYKNKFLSFLKYDRFKQIQDSIVNEQLINNKYLWLYLKMHREIGCDQKVNILNKKIIEDETDTPKIKRFRR